MKIGVLGPAGSFSEIAAKKYDKKAEIVFFKYIYEIFDAVKKGRLDEGIVPIENMIEGTVREVLDKLYSTDLKINKQVIVPIRHCLASQSSGFRIISSHPQAIAQCSGFLKKYIEKGIDVRESTSTSAAMELARKEKDVAAIGSEYAAGLNGLNLIARNIENNHDNATSFYVISKEETESRKKAKYKTHIALHPSEDRPGLLFDILAVFKIQQINLTKIESRPTEKKLGEYIFYIEFDGHQTDKNIQAALVFLRSIIPTIKIFGSYEVQDD